MTDPAASPPRCAELASPLGPVGVLWRLGADGARVERVVLPNRLPALAGPLPRATCSEIEAFSERLLRFLRGEDVAFDVRQLALERCSHFQRAVLLAQSAVPRGRVTTYGRLAARLGIPGAARAVGKALADNPFPLIVPCHRTVRADGRLGGFGGGLEMKRGLLRLEGVEVDADDRVVAPRWAV